MILPTLPKSILLDFDGVIVDSVEIKSLGFQASYPDAGAEQIAAIDAYHYANGGISRREKFRHFESALFGRVPTAASIEALSDRYKAAVYEKVLVCNYIAGAEEFLDGAARMVSLHLISGTPQDELEAVVNKRGLSGYFGRVIGAPMQKRDAFASLCEAAGHAPAEAIAVGDSTTEFEAAQALGMPFVGIVAAGKKSPFPADVPCLPDMVGLAKLLGLGSVGRSSRN